MVFLTFFFLHIVYMHAKSIKCYIISSIPRQFNACKTMISMFYFIVRGWLQEKGSANWKSKERSGEFKCEYCLIQCHGQCHACYYMLQYNHFLHQNEMWVFLCSTWSVTKTWSWVPWPKLRSHWQIQKHLFRNFKCVAQFYYYSIRHMWLYMHYILSCDCVYREILGLLPGRNKKLKVNWKKARRSEGNWLLQSMEW
jgi:hypothetical protein